MELIFKEIPADKFFPLLPDSWLENIVPYWEQYKLNTKIYGLFDGVNILAGGIVFSTCSPDMQYNPEEALNWLDKGYLYIGFLWVPEAYRGKKLGSEWLHLLMQRFPEQKFWLTVEEEDLIQFYKKNRFKLIKSLKNDHDTDWLMVYEP
jgi:ribosomal protein S18 acetylase RimI-like enzyme